MERTYWCIDDGRALDESFSVIPTEPHPTVDDLKRAINKILDLKKTRSIDLILYKWTMPHDVDKKSILDFEKLPEKMKLDSREFVSGLALDADDTYILVQKPPAHAHVLVPPRPSTPPLKCVPQGHIDQELAVILNNLQHHRTSDFVVDSKEAEAYQKKRLGPFFKRILPYHGTAADIKLVMLGLELDRKARTTTNETLRSIVEGDIGALSGNRVIAMVAPSGSGKTATVIDLATKHFVIYCVCSTPSAVISADFNDPNFITLAADVEMIYTAIESEEQGNLIRIDEKTKALARQRVYLEFLARLLFLQLLLNYTPGLEPEQYFREQTTTGGASTIRTLVHKLREYDTITIEAMLHFTQTKLHAHLVPRRLGLVIALDEAQVTENYILAGKLISPSALNDFRNNMDAIFDSKNHVRSIYRRGFLTPLSAALSGMRATLVILGTSLSLQNADHVYSALDKTVNFTRITDFPQFDSIDINKMISDLVDLSDCEIPPAKRIKLSGRARFSLGIVKRLNIADETQFSKQATLDTAIDLTIESVKRGLREGVSTIMKSDKSGEAARLLSRMALAYRLHDSKISFSSQQQSDFVNKSLCRLREHPDGVHLIMDEPIVLDAVEEELAQSGTDPAYKEYMDQLVQILENFGLATTSKGDALEPLVRRSLQRFNGFLLADLPFLQGIALPNWCYNLRLQIDEINTPAGFGYTSTGTAADQVFLTDCPPNKMLIAKFGTRPDGAWFFSDKRYAGSLAVKFYSSNVPQAKHLENITSSNIRSCFLQKDGKKFNETLKRIRDDFETSGTPSSLMGILRIHIALPDVQSGMPATYVLTDPKTGAEDVMVFINLANMDTFFYEGIEERRDEMVKLKNIIRYVCQK
ncbi:hypothetical protein EMPS_10695 [Entomortierella parvispora]|uniref:Uncharacterized protein n=1 Tax=Entomortierella parvispora TaxID=205924 RepID=A0A9P3HKM5_9FUNG|nr:hypothetical protein EMPS_10695 [Entomortierella parvispora]